MEQHNFVGVNAQTLSQRVMRRVFGWMFAGLLMTAVIAIILGSNPNVPAYFFQHGGTQLGIAIVQLIVVVALSALLPRLSVTMASFGFFLYAALTGVTFSLIFAFYDPGAISSAFLITAGMFGLCALFGYVTKMDLTRIGFIALMIVLGLVLASVVNIFFFHSGGFSLLVSYAMVILFSIVTAYDIQKIKQMLEHVQDEETANKMAIYGALMLYLDFIIIFRNLLNILRSR